MSFYWTRRVFFASCFVFCAALATAGPPGATSRVKAVLDKAMELQTRPELAGDAHRQERAKLIRQLISESFLSSEMASESVKGHWEQLTAQQRNEFQQLFTTLFQDSYTRMVLNFLQKETIEYREESREKNGMLVRTVIMRANEHIPVDYHMVERSGRWLIRDVEIDGVSIVENYRKTFKRVIVTGSFEALIQKMRLQSQAIRDEVAS